MIQKPGNVVTSSYNSRNKIIAAELNNCYGVRVVSAIHTRTEKVDQIFTTQLCAQDRTLPPGYR